MITPADQSFLRRALRLAMNGRGHVEPNPMVGCVLVRDGQIIGEGWHAKVGEAHAEPNALADCRARGNDPSGATAYVTLEPCCHTNKRTPPCVPRLVEARVARVVVGCIDPSDAVNGQGLAQLRAAGIEVDILSDSLAPVPGGEGWGEGVVAGRSQNANAEHRTPNAERRTGKPHVTTPSPPPSPPGTGERELNASQFQQLIAPFTVRHLQRRPYVTLKWTETADGAVAGPGGRRLQISNAASSHFVHLLRARSDAIMVGVNTVLNDDPRLDVRIDDPYRRLDQIYVLDSDARTPPTAKLFEVNGWISIVHASGDGVDIVPRLDRVGKLIERPQTTAIGVHSPEGRVSLPELFSFSDYLSETHLFVEAGPRIARSFFDAGLCDRLLVTRSRTRVDDATAPRSAAIPNDFIPTTSLNLAGDTLTEYLNTRSPAFFAATPSADLVLAAEEARTPLELP